MKILKAFISTGILLFLSNYSHGADWWIANFTEDEIVFIDLESIKSEGYDSRKSWFQTFDKDGRHAKVLAFYNCKDEEIGIKAIYNYKPDGSSDNSRSNEYIDYKPVAPETIGYLLLNVSCSDEPQLQLTGEWQGRIKNGMTPSEFSTKTFKLLKEKKKSTPNKNNGKGKI